MVSIHSHKAFDLARSKGAVAAASYETWEQLTSLSKRELAEIVMHLGALCADSVDGYDDAIAGDAKPALERVMEEHRALKTNGLI